MFKKLISLILSSTLITSQPVFAQGVAQLNLANYLSSGASAMAVDKFRPVHMRYFSYDTASDQFEMLLDKGDYDKSPSHQVTRSPEEEEKGLKEESQKLMEYFRVGLALPNEKFWVNLRPDAEDQIIDPELEKTDMGRIMLEADLQLKKDVSSLTSPQNKEGKVYWDKLYKKAGELFGTENITIPTITRPWIVPGEIIIREGQGSAYIYKANMKVMLEEDYLKSPGHQVTSHQYSFSDPRMKELNEYSTRLIKELIIPGLTKEVNSAKRYAGLRQVFFSLVLSRWFKDTYKGTSAQEHHSTSSGTVPFTSLIDSHNLNNLTSKESWSKGYYFNEYKKSFEKGEYNLQEEIATPTGQVIRTYVSGGINNKDMHPASYSSPVEGKNKFLGIKYTTLLDLVKYARNAVGWAALPYFIYAAVVTGASLVGANDMSWEDHKSLFGTTVAIIGFESFLDWAKKKLSNKLKDTSTPAPTSENSPEMKREDVPGNDHRVALMIAKDLQYDGESIEITKVSNIILIVSVFKEILKRAPTKKEVKKILKLKGKEGVVDIDGITFAAREEANKQRENYKNATAKVSKSNENLDILETLVLPFVNVFFHRLDRAPSPKELEKIEIIFIKKKEPVEFANALIDKKEWNRIINDAEVIMTDYDPDGGELPRGAKTEFLRIIIRYKSLSGEFPAGGTVVDLYRMGAGDRNEETGKGVIEGYLNVQKLLRGKNNTVGSPLGGIDFRAMNYLTQPMGSFQGLNFTLPVLSLSALEAIDLDKELKSIRTMVQQGMIPSGARIKEYLAACFQKGRIEEKQDDLILCMVELCRLLEEENLESAPELREAIVIADSGRFVLETGQKIALN